ncbi:MAG: ATP-binding protein [Anaerolineae bacterium]|nr:ATP-binding protein [Anaerolineae bacterium]
MLIMMAGLPGTGKSTLAKELARLLPGFVLSKDVIRATLFPKPYIEYSTQQDDFCVKIILETAEYLLAKYPHEYVILDGRTFSKRYQVDQVVKVATRLNTPLKVIECVVSDETAKARIAQDFQQGTHVAANRTPELYAASKPRFEPIELPKLVLDTEQPLEVCVDACIRHIRQFSRES